MELSALQLPSVRECFPQQPIPKTGDQELDLLDGVNITTILPSTVSLPQTLREATSGSKVQSSGFHRIFFEIPKAVGRRFNRDPCSKLVVPTPFLQAAIQNAYRSCILADRILAAGNFALGPQIEGFAYEAFGVDYLLATRSTTIVHVRDTTDSYTIPPSTYTALLPFPIAGGILDLEFGMYAPKVTFPSLDAIYFTPTSNGNRFTIIQVTSSKRHSSVDDGIVSSIKLFKAAAPNATWSFVFVVPNEEKGKALVAARTGMLQRKGDRSSSRNRTEMGLEQGVGIVLGYTVVTDSPTLWKALSVSLYITFATFLTLCSSIFVPPDTARFPDDPADVLLRRGHAIDVFCTSLNDCERSDRQGNVSSAASLEPRVKTLPANRSQGSVAKECGETAQLRQ